MSDFSVERGVPLERSPGAYASYPFGEMNVTDSFFVGADTATEMVVSERRLRSAASAYGRKHKMKFLVRNVEGGLRCWRVR